MRTSRKDIRRNNAKEAAKRRASLTDEQQLQRLDLLLGAGNGAKKERKRLTLRIEAANSGPKPVKMTQEEKTAKAAARIQDLKKHQDKKKD